MDETTREEILTYVLRARVRLRDDAAEVERLLALFEQRFYRSRFYMKAFYLRVGKGDLKGAVGQLVKARDVGKYIKLVIGDLARCYQRLGWWPQLQDLVREQEAYIGRNPVLLDVQAGMLIAQGDWQAAEQVIRRLRTYPGKELTLTVGKRCSS